MGESVPARASILVVDDEPLLTRTIARTLANEFEVSAFTSAREALACVTAGMSYAAIVCDLLMAEMTGMELYEELVRVAPSQAGRMLFLTGGAFTPAARAFVDQAEQIVIRKPFDREALRDAVRRMVLSPQALPLR